MNKQLKGAKDRNCKVLTSAVLSDVSMNKQKNQRNFSTKLHLVLFTQNVRKKNYKKRQMYLQKCVRKKIIKKKKT